MCGKRREIGCVDLAVEVLVAAEGIAQQQIPTADRLAIEAADAETGGGGVSNRSGMRATGGGGRRDDPAGSIPRPACKPLLELICDGGNVAAQESHVVA